MSRPYFTVIIAGILFFCSACYSTPEPEPYRPVYNPPPRQVVNQTPVVPAPKPNPVATEEILIFRTELGPAMDDYNSENGAYPEKLDDLVTKEFISALPVLPVGTKIEYDPQNGIEGIFLVRE